MTKVSVIIPAYNAECYIAQAIDSVIAQTYRDFELIVVDDGSTDRTGEIVRSYGSQAIYVYQSNKERAAARNTGIRHSCGEYLSFLDADDIWEPHKLERQVDLLDQAPEVALVYAWAYTIDATGRRMSNGDRCLLRSFESGARVFEALLFENVIASPTVLVRKTCLDVVGAFDETLTYVEDWDLWLRVAISYPVAVIPEPLASYRTDGNSLLEKWGKYDVPSGRVRVLEKACSSLRGRTELKPLIRQALGSSYWWAAVTSHRLGRLRQARGYGLRALAHGHGLRLGENTMGIWADLLLGRSMSAAFRPLACRIPYLPNRQREDLRGKDAR